MAQKLILTLGLLLFALVPFTLGQAKMATSTCNLSVAELPALAGVTFDMKIEDVKKLYKSVRVLTPPKNEIMGQPKITTFRPITTDPIFKSDLVTIELAQSSKFGITSIALNFRPKTKLMPDDLFTKITLETGLLPSFWTYNDFGGQANYRKWDVICKDFSASFIVQTGYMNRLSIWRSPGSDPTKKPIDQRNVGKLTVIAL